MTQDDLDGVGTSLDTDESASVSVEDSQEFANWDGGEDEPRVSGRVIPSFPYYVVKLQTGTALRFSRKKGTPSGRIGFKVVEGLEESINEAVFDDLYLAVSRDERTGDNDPDGNPVTTPKSAEKLGEDFLKFQHKLNKISRVFGFATPGPRNKSEGELAAYVSQFNVAADADAHAIVEIRVEPGRNGGSARNRIIFESLRGLEDQAVDKKLRAEKKNALVEARQRIAERKQAGQGSSAGAMRRPAASVALD